MFLSLHFSFQQIFAAIDVVSFQVQIQFKWKSSAFLLFIGGRRGRRLFGCNLVFCIGIMCYTERSMACTWHCSLCVCAQCLLTFLAFLSCAIRWCHLQRWATPAQPRKNKQILRRCRPNDKRTVRHCCSVAAIRGEFVGLSTVSTVNVYKMWCDNRRNSIRHAIKVKIVDGWLLPSQSVLIVKRNVDDSDNFWRATALGNLSHCHTFTIVEMWPLELNCWDEFDDQ